MGTNEMPPPGRDGARGAFVLPNKKHRRVAVLRWSALSRTTVPQQPRLSCSCQAELAKECRRDSTTGMTSAAAARGFKEGHRVARLFVVSLAGGGEEQGASEHLSATHAWYEGHVVHDTEPGEMVRVLFDDGNDMEIEARPDVPLSDSIIQLQCLHVLMIR